MFQPAVVNQSLNAQPWTGAGGFMGVQPSAAITAASSAPLLGVSEELRTNTTNCCSGAAYGRWCQDTNNTTPAVDRGALPPRGPASGPVHCSLGCRLMSRPSTGTYVEEPPGTLQTSRILRDQGCQMRTAT